VLAPGMARRGTAGTRVFWYGGAAGAKLTGSFGGSAYDAELTPVLAEQGV